MRGLKWGSSLAIGKDVVNNGSPASVAIVVLAFSRFEMLKRLIGALRKQTRKADEIIVVYQGDREDAFSWLASQNDITVMRQENFGSAGGFCSGIEESIKRGHGWTWIFDDDAIPEPDSLERLVSNPYFERDDTAWMASRILDRDGKTYMSPVPADANLWYPTVLSDGCVEVVRGCWLGLLVNSRAVQKFGLPIADFFLLEEDLEFTERLARNGKAYCAIRSVIVHYQDTKVDASDENFFRYAHFVRNKIARTKLHPGPSYIKLLRGIRTAAHFSLLVANRKAPLRTIPWIVRGLIFRPQIRYPADCAASKGTPFIDRTNSVLD